MDEIGCHDEAFSLFEAGNQAKKQELSYDFMKDRALFDHIKRAFSPDIMAYVQDRASQSATMMRPIFIVGMPRSGSTLVEQILGAHEEVAAGGEMNALDRAIQPHVQRFLDRPSGPSLIACAQAIRRDYLEFAGHYIGDAAIFTDKMPINFRWIGFVIAAFPEAKIVCTERTKMAVLWSSFRTLFTGRGNGFSYDLSDAEAYFDRYVDLIDHWKNALKGGVNSIRYVDLTTETEREVKNLLAHCELGWQSQCASPHESTGPVSTASALQVRRKNYSGGSKTWECYADHIAESLGRPRAESGGAAPRVRRQRGQLATNHRPATPVNATGPKAPFQPPSF